MLKRPLYQPFTRPVHQTLRGHLRAVKRGGSCSDISPRRRVKALWPQVQKFPDRQDVPGFAQDHRWGLAQGAWHPAEEAQHHHQPRHGPMLGPLFTKAEDLACFARITMAVAAMGPFDEGSIDVGGGRGIYQPLLQLRGRAKDQPRLDRLDPRAGRWLWPKVTNRAST